MVDQPPTNITPSTNITPPPPSLPSHPRYQYSNHKFNSGYVNQRKKKKVVQIICQGPPPTPVKLVISENLGVTTNATNSKAVAVKSAGLNSTTGWKLLTKERGTVGFEYARQTTAALLAYFRGLSTSAINPLEYNYAPQSDVQVGATYESKVRERCMCARVGLG